MTKAKDAAIETVTVCHACRAAGITYYLGNSGTLENVKLFAYQALV